MRGGKTPQQRNRRTTALDAPDEGAGFGAEDAPTHADQPRFDPIEEVDPEDPIAAAADVDDEPAPALPMLHVAIFESVPHLPAAERSIVMANHAVVVATTGRDGVATVAHALAAGGIDAGVVGMPGGERGVDAAQLVT
ncbi:MAG: hypothetical protein AB7L28_18540, partial [Kofleriaceae bacterium]